MSVNPYSSDGTLPSNNAVKVALQTMKERCHKLQNRLSLLEEENLQLRIERHKVPLKSDSPDPKNDSPSLFRQVEELSKQKSQLSHHVYMMANENKALWDRLSKISCPGEVGYPSHGNLTFRDASAFSSKPIKSMAIADSWGGHEESLEEISLKVLNNIIKNKMISGGEGIEVKSTDLTNSMNGCEFQLVCDEDYMDDDEYVMCEVKELCDTVKLQKEILREQQASLKKSFEIISNVLEGGVPCKKCKTQKEPEPKALEEVVPATDQREVSGVLPSSPIITNSLFTSTKGKYEFEDRICPICAKFYTKSTPFNDFNDHVVSHFIHKGEDEPDSLVSDSGMIT